MRMLRFEVTLAALLAVLFAAFWLWQTPGGGAKLTRGEIDAFLTRVEAAAPMEPVEKAEFLARLRSWAEADDGGPIYMLNVMRYFEQLRKLPGVEAISGTPVEANATYEKAVAPMLAKLGGYALLVGDTTGVGGRDKPASNLMDFDRAVDGWDRILVVRYPSRRAFLRLITNPEYLKVMPYKLSALEVALVPVSPQVVIPDLRWIAGALCVIVFLGAGWLRATQRGGAPAVSGSADRIRAPSLKA